MGGASINKGASFNIKLYGLEQLQKNLKALGDELGTNVIQNAIRRVARRLQADIRAKAPVGSGKDKSKRQKGHGQIGKSIKVDVKAYKGAYSIGRVWQSNKIAPHGHNVEYGHRTIRKDGSEGRTQPRPYFRPAVDAVEAKWNELMKEEISKGIQKALKKMKK